LHRGCIELALLGVDQRVGFRQLIRDSCATVSYGRAGGRRPYL
jgi:hypothetical protein